MTTDWTQDDITFLRKNIGKMTYREIGVALGRTKSAIIGKADRLGLRGEAVRIAANKRRARPERRVKQRKGNAPIFKKPKKARAALVVATEYTLGRHQCSWPIGDPKEAGFHFCGQPAVHGKSYCPPHLEQGTVGRPDGRPDWGKPTSGGMWGR